MNKFFLLQKRVYVNSDWTMVAWFQTKKDALDYMKEFLQTECQYKIEVVYEPS